MFQMLQGETIYDVQKHFTHIVNHLSGLSKNFDTSELNIKVLKTLNMNWQPKVTTITKSQKPCNNVHGISLQKVKGARA